MKTYPQRIAAIDEHMRWAYWHAHPEQIPASWKRAAARLREIVLAGGMTMRAPRLDPDRRVCNTLHRLSGLTDRPVEQPRGT
jgi:hypothetical protein